MGIFGIFGNKEVPPITEEDIATKPYLTGGCIKKPQANPTNWQFSKLACAKETTEASLPPEWSIKDKFGPVYTQTCGSCTSNAVCACDAYYYHRGKDNWVPSTIFCYYNQKCNEKPMEDDGSSVEAALDVVRHKGVCNSTVWPNTKPYNKKPSKAAYKNGLKGHEVTKYYQVKSFLQIKKALVKGYPVAIAMAWAFSHIDPVTHILNDPDPEDIEECYNGHALVIVGYDDNKKLFEIRNSWGPNWGNNGYGYVTYKTMKKAIWYDDSYAVVK